MTGKLVLTIFIDPFKTPNPIGRLIITSSVKVKEFYRHECDIPEKEAREDNGAEALDRMLGIGLQKCLELAEESAFCGGGVMVQTEDLKWREKRAGKPTEIQARAKKLVEVAAGRYGISFTKVMKEGRDWAGVSGEVGWVKKKPPIDYAKS